MLEMNELAKRNYNELSKREQEHFIKLIEINVTRFTYHVFSKIGRQLSNTLQKDKFDYMVQDVVMSLLNTLQNEAFDSGKAKFSTVLGTYVQNKVFKEGYLERMAKRKGVLVPLLIENEDGTTTEYLTADENVEEQVLETMDRDNKIDLVRSAISEFPKREQKIIYMRMQEKTLEEIGQEIGLTRERVRQIIAKMHSQLKEKLEKVG